MTRTDEILRILRCTYRVPIIMESRRDPFKTLIVTILSQNTNDKNTRKAFERLSNNFRIDPETLAKAHVKQLEASLKVAGLYRNKARVIKEISKIMNEKYHDDLWQILSKPVDQARRDLMLLPGVGPKTADVVLLFAANRPTVPVDTHVNRVSRRLGLASENGGYEVVREALQSLYHPRDYLAIHLLLIAHGRRFCRARFPLCMACPLNELCPSRSLFRRVS